MQADFDKDYPSTGIQILGINEVGKDGNNAGFTAGRDLPWLQDVDANNNGESDVWYDSWGITYRDVVVLDANNDVTGVVNVTSHNLADPANYMLMKSTFLEGVVPDWTPDWYNTLDPLDVDGENGAVPTPLDALLVINALDDYPNGLLPESRADGSPYLDVNSDGFVAPLDALLVINQLPSSAARDPGIGRSWSPLSAEANSIASDRLGQTASVDQAMAEFDDANSVSPMSTDQLHTPQRIGLVNPYTSRALDERLDESSDEEESILAPGGGFRLT